MQEDRAGPLGMFDPKKKDPTTAVKHAVLTLKNRRLSRKQILAENGDSHIRQYEGIDQGKASVDHTDGIELEREYESVVRANKAISSILDRPRGLEAQRIRKQRQAVGIAKFIHDEKERERDKSIRKGLWMPQAQQEQVNKTRMLCMLILNQDPESKLDKKGQISRFLGQTTIQRSPRQETSSNRTDPVTLLPQPSNTGHTVNKSLASFAANQHTTSVNSRYESTLHTLRSQEWLPIVENPLSPPAGLSPPQKQPVTEPNTSILLSKGSPKSGVPANVHARFRPPPMYAVHAGSARLFLPEGSQSEQPKHSILDGATPGSLWTTGPTSVSVQKVTGAFSHRDTGSVLAGLKSKAKIRELLTKAETDNDAVRPRLRKPLLREIADKPLLAIDSNQDNQRPTSKLLSAAVGPSDPQIPEKLALAPSARKSISSVGFEKFEKVKRTTRADFLDSFGRDMKQHDVSQTITAKEFDGEMLSGLRGKLPGHANQSLDLGAVRQHRALPLLEGLRSPFRLQKAGMMQRSESPSKLHRGESRGDRSIFRQNPTPRPPSGRLGGLLSGWDNLAGRADLEPGGIEDLY